MSNKLILKALVNVRTIICKCYSGEISSHFLCFLIIYLNPLRFSSRNCVWDSFHSQGLHSSFKCLYSYCKELNCICIYGFFFHSILGRSCANVRCREFICYSIWGTKWTKSNNDGIVGLFPKTEVDTWIRAIGIYKTGKFQST